MLWVVGITCAVASLCAVHWTRREAVPRTTPRPVTSPQADGWEQPDNMGRDDWRADEPDVPDPDPESSSKARRAMFQEGWRGLPFGSRIECPKCGAGNRVRRGDYADTHNVDGGGTPVVMKFSVRTRDSAIYCWRCDEVFYRMSEDSVIRHVPPAEAA